MSVADELVCAARFGSEPAAVDADFIHIPGTLQIDEVSENLIREVVPATLDIVVAGAQDIEQHMVGVDSAGKRYRPLELHPSCRKPPDSLLSAE